MLVAELRRKLMTLDDIVPDRVDVLDQIRSLLGETKEDLLTADVFGVLKYLPRNFYLDAVLTAIGDRNSQSEPYQRHLSQLRTVAARLAFRFWPNYATPEGLPGSRTEPDVELTGQDTLILVEAKLASGFGNLQVERELAVAIEESKGRNFFVVLVTPSSLPPHFSYDGKRWPFADYLNRVAASDDPLAGLAAKLATYADRVLWISWDAILNALIAAKDRHQQAAGEQSDDYCRASDMLDDLMEVMSLRRLQPFRGLEQPVAVRFPCKDDWRWRLTIKGKAEGQPDSFSIAEVVRSHPIPPQIRSRIRFSIARRHDVCRKQPSPTTGGGNIDLAALVGRWDIHSGPFSLFPGVHKR